MAPKLPLFPSPVGRTEARGYKGSRGPAHSPAPSPIPSHGPTCCAHCCSAALPAGARHGHPVAVSNGEQLGDRRRLPWVSPAAVLWGLPNPSFPGSPSQCLQTPTSHPHPSAHHPRPLIPIPVLVVPSQHNLSQQSISRERQQSVLGQNPPLPAAGWARARPGPDMPQEPGGHAQHRSSCQQNQEHLPEDLFQHEVELLLHPACP